MSKRKAVDCLRGIEPAPKRSRPITTTDQFSKLSDELLLRVLSHVDVGGLALCQRVSQRLRVISGDSQLWREAYYDRFVRPRFNRLPKSRRSPHPSRLARWLDESALLERGRNIQWKKQYKLRYKWSQGICDMTEIPVTTRPPLPPLLARLHEGIVYTVDSQSGLRAWSYRDKQVLLSSFALPTTTSTSSGIKPSSLAVDTALQRKGEQRLIVGFEDGSFTIVTYVNQARLFRHIHSHPKSSTGTLTAVALATPYILTMTERQTMSLYRMDSSSSHDDQYAVESPRLLVSLKSNTVWPPLSLALRMKGDGVVAAVAYSMPAYNAGWSVGVQELHVSPAGEVIESRIASAAAQWFPVSGTERSTAVLSKPTSLSYSHPYLLLSHADNTLTLYLVNSTASSLSVGPGKRLWGHTSSVFDAHVGGRGKAVSVSTRGNEIRVWELEGTTLAKPDAPAYSEISIQVTPEKRMTRDYQPLASRLGTGFFGSSGSTEQRLTGESDVTRGWVGFDDESLVVLREHHQGRQALAVYDFS